MDEAELNKQPGREEEEKKKAPIVPVRDVMYKMFVSVTPDTPVRKLFRLFVKHRLLAVPVVDDEEHLIGIITSADLMYRSSKPHIPRTLPVIGSKIMTSRINKYAKEFRTLMDEPCEKLMTRDVVITTPDTDIEQVAAAMVIEHLKVIPVVVNKRVVGMITRANVLKQLYKEYND